jgi:hypothetical protein
MKWVLARTHAPMRAARSSQSWSRNFGQVDKWNDTMARACQETRDCGRSAGPQRCRRQRSPASCEIIKDLETVCRRPSQTWVNFTTQSNTASDSPECRAIIIAQQFESVLSSS